MRCRFCSKSIPLLRRLSDAQFCSDAHRDAYSDEQKLAFERLMTTQSVGKTQRMPAYSQAAEIPQTRPPTETMVAAGGFQAYFLDAPLPFGKRGISAEPVATSLTVFFCEHPTSFPVGFRQSGRMARVSVKPGRSNPKPQENGGFLSGYGASLPRAATRPIRWEYRAPGAGSDPAFITRLWPVECSASNMAVSSNKNGVLWLAHAMHSVPPLRAHTGRLRLQSPDSLYAVAQPDALLTALGPWRLEMLPAWALILSYPAGEGIRAIAEGLPAKLGDAAELDALFEAFANQPLASSRHLPALAAVPRFGAAPATELLPLPAARSPLPAHVTDPAGASALPWVTRTFAPGIVEPVRPARPAMAECAPLAIDAASPGKPRRMATPRPPEIAKSTGLRPLGPIAGAAWAHSARFRNAHAIDTQATPYIPAAQMFCGLRLPLAGVTPYVAKIALARSNALGWTPEPSTVAAAPVIPELAGKHRMAVQTKGAVLAIPAPAPRQCAVEGLHAESLAPAYRPSTPAFRQSPLRGGHTEGRTRCFAVPAPSPRSARWPGSESEWRINAEVALLPGAVRLLGRCSLQRPATALFRVPNAQPLPKAGANSPLALPMSDWGSKPLMRPTNLRASDGSDFKETATSGWRISLRDRFASFGSLPTFGRIRRLPPDIKWIAMAVPLIIGIWVVARPEGKASNAPIQISGGVPQAEVEPIPAPPGTEDVQAAAVAEPEPPGLKKQKKEVRPVAAVSAEPSRWDILRAKIAERAEVDIIEDFRSGLSRWDGKGNWARTWSYDRSGTVRPGNLAIFEPTTGLRDYSFEMKAAVDKRVIQWLVRAQDLSNYHINRLIITPDAAQTKLELQRWTVHKGRAGRVKLVPLPHGPANQTLFSVRVDVQGESVTTYLGDQVIDTFSDARFASGGIGLAGAPGDQARVYAVRVSHQTDFLGKLCSFLAPQPMNMQGTD